MATGYQEGGLSEAALNMHRALQSLVEELEAVDWYNQRADVCTDPDLKAILLHNRNEEKEHATMLLEWIRRQDPSFEHQLRGILFREGPVTGEHPA